MKFTEQAKQYVERSKRFQFTLYYDEISERLIRCTLSNYQRCTYLIFDETNNSLKDKYYFEELLTIIKKLVKIKL